MARLPEGPRRLCVLVGLCLVLAWCWGIRDLFPEVFRAFADYGVATVTPIEWLFLFAILLVVPEVAFLLPFLATRVFLWVKGGFDADANWSATTQGGSPED